MMPISQGNRSKLGRQVSAVLLVSVLALIVLVMVPLPEERYERAVFKGDPKQVREAVSQEPNVNRFVYPPTLENRLRRRFGYGLIGRTHPMVAAVKGGSIESMQELAGAGVDVNAHDGAGFRALALASLNSDVKAAEALLDLGADPNLRWKDGTPMHRGATPVVLELFKRRGIKLLP